MIIEINPDKEYRRKILKLSAIFASYFSNNTICPLSKNCKVASKHYTFVIRNINQNTHKMKSKDEKLNKLNK